DSISTLKEERRLLESRAEALHSTQLDIIASLQNLLPGVVSSLDISLRTISGFNGKPYTPLSQILPSLPTISDKSRIRRSRWADRSNAVSKPSSRENSSRASIQEKSGCLAMARSMVAACLLERVPFNPVDSLMLSRRLETDSSLPTTHVSALRELGGESGAIHAVELALRSLAEDHSGVELEMNGRSRMTVVSIDRNRLSKELPGTKQQQNYNDANYNDKNRIGEVDMWSGSMMMMGSVGMGMVGGVPRGVVVPPPMQRPPSSMAIPSMLQGGNGIPMKPRTEDDDVKDIEALLNKKSFREMQKSKTGEELLDLIHRPTAKETAVAARFKSKGGSQVKEYCTSLTKEDCRRQSGSFIACDKVHFRRIIAAHTDMNLGDCSFLDTCRHMKTCKYVHYELDSTPDVSPMMMGGGPPPRSLKPQSAHYCSEVELGEPQWINCDIRSFRMDILGQFGVIMADPPWDIHMELPYGTMADDEMRTLNVPALQTDGLIFLWVTGRAMELGRECLELWGYKRVEEIIWVKTNQLQRIIRTGRTGHWLNHSKEHCLVGLKGNPEVNRNIDTDVIVAEVRETSRKPDEMYPMLERISPRTRKLELFARMHNVQAGWLSLGNQLQGVRLVDEGLRARFKAAYPDVQVHPTSPPRP
ncbi:hypothetical protein M569_04344, partial [Genlisea aurea]